MAGQPDDCAGRDASPCIDAGSNALAGSAVFDAVGACRVVDGNGDGTYVVDMGARELQTCAPNCDCSSTPPVLNALDFNCFLNRFTLGDPYANCDQSTSS